MTSQQRGMRLEEIVKHLDKGLPQGLCDVEKAWISWQLQKAVGSSEDWDAFCKRVNCIRRLSTYCLYWHEYIFKDGWAIKIMRQKDGELSVSAVYEIDKNKIWGYRDGWA